MERRPHPEADVKTNETNPEAQAAAEKPVEEVLPPELCERLRSMAEVLNMAHTDVVAYSVKHLYQVLMSEPSEDAPSGIPAALLMARKPEIPAARSGRDRNEIPQDRDACDALPGTGAGKSAGRQNEPSRLLDRIGTSPRATYHALCDAEAFATSLRHGIGRQWGRVLGVGSAWIAALAAAAGVGTVAGAALIQRVFVPAAQRAERPEPATQEGAVWMPPVAHDGRASSTANRGERMTADILPSPRPDPARDRRHRRQGSQAVHRTTSSEPRRTERREAKRENPVSHRPIGAWERGEPARRQPAKRAHRTARAEAQPQRSVAVPLLVQPERELPRRPAADTFAIALQRERLERQRSEAQFRLAEERERLERQRSEEQFRLAELRERAARQEEDE